MSNLLNIKDQSGNWIPIPVVTNGIKSITQNQDYTLTITLNDGTTYTTTSIKGEDGQDYVLTEQDKQEIAGFVDTPVDDVQINGQSIVESGVANIPYGSNDNYGLLKASSTNGIFASGGVLSINNASESDIKGGTEELKPLTPNREHMAIFYGLAKASGDKTQSQSDNPVGTYTDEAKASIKNMLGVEDVDIDSKAPVITETISGDIVSFDDGANDMPLQSLVVDINPVQDLHGYDSPWPAGGGVNTLDPESLIEQYPNHVYGLAITRSGEWITINGTYSNEIQTSQFRFMQKKDGSTFDDTYWAFPDSNSSNNIPGWISKADSNKTLTIVLNNMIQGTTYNLRFRLMGTTDTTRPTDWTPYENICPITGFTGCEVQRTGINIFDGEIESGDYDVTESKGGVKRSNASRMRCANYIPVKPNTTYYSKMPYLNSIVVFYDEEKWMHSGGFAVVRNTTFTTPSWCKYITFYYSETQYNNDISINYPATDTEYHDYKPSQTYPITFPSEAGTVYGAYVDVPNGELVVTHAEVDMGTLMWTYYASGNYFYATIPDRISYIEALPKVVSMCDKYKYFGLGASLELQNNMPNANYGFTTTSAKRYIYLKDNRYTNVNDLVASLSGTQLVYALTKDSIITYPLTQIETPKTLLGQNNLWANTGDVEVEYRASTKMYIDRKITEAVAAALNS